MKLTAMEIRALWSDNVVLKLHDMVANEELTDEERATMLVQVIDEAEELLGPIYERLNEAENRQLSLLKQ